MSQQNQGSTSISYDDADVDEPLYAYGRAYQKGPQQGFILSAQAKTWPDGGRQIDFTIGTGCPSMPGKGTKCDYRIRIPSPEWGEFLRFMGVVPVKGQQIDLTQFKDKEVLANLSDEVDRKKSEETGQKVMRAKCLSISAPRPIAPAKPPPVPAAPAAQSQPKPPAFQ